MIIDRDTCIHYLTGELGEKEKQAVENWMNASDANMKQMEELFFLLNVGNLVEAYDSADSEKAYARFKAKFHQRNQRKQLRTLFVWTQRIAALLFIPLLLFTYYGMQQPTVIEEPQFVEVRTESGMISSFNLPDGTKVWLNAGGSLRYPVHFDKAHRQIEMTGQAYFEVTKDAHRPFEVKVAPDYAVEVLGTSFNITAYANEDEIETTLVEGSVQLNLGAASQVTKQCLKPSEKAVYNKSKRELSITSVDTEFDTAWREGRMVFKGHPMSYVLKQLSRRYNVQFNIKNKKVNKSILTGRFKGETLAQVLEYLRVSSGISYRIHPSTITDKDTLAPNIVEIWTK